MLAHSNLTDNFDVKLSIGPGIDLSERLRISNGLCFEPGRAHGKAQSTDLYVSEEWAPFEAGRLAVPEVVTSNPEMNFSIFKVSSELVEAIIKKYDPSSGILSNSILEIEDTIYAGMQDLMKNRFGSETKYQLDRKAVLLRSFPSQNLSSGQTTNGLHFDLDDSRSIRIGINLGSIARNVYYVPIRREALLPGKSDKECQTMYQELVKLNISALSVQINSGEGWSLPTTEFLHDGRRAIPDGFSSFMLFRATLKR